MLTQGSRKITSHFKRRCIPVVCVQRTGRPIAPSSLFTGYQVIHLPKSPRLPAKTVLTGEAKGEDGCLQLILMLINQNLVNQINVLGPWKIINPQSYLSFRPYSVLMPTVNISICTVGISTEYEPKSGVIFVDLFLSMTLNLNL